jgi:hypothetical protein
VLQRSLGLELNIINLGMPGFGLTQEIRTFYEFGNQYSPRTVILQFSKNDPIDNLKNPVTEFRDGQFVFKNIANSISFRIQSLFNRSLIQYSQLYSFIRYNMLFALYKTFFMGPIHYDNKTMNPNQSEYLKNHEAIDRDKAVTQIESCYNNLLNPFAKDMKRRGIRLLMISVNGQLNEFPEILAEVRELDKEGILEYVDVQPWFSGFTGYDSPEGHKWGVNGHRIIGENLASIVRHSK